MTSDCETAGLLDEGVADTFVQWICALASGVMTLAVTAGGDVTSGTGYFADFSSKAFLITRAATVSDELPPGGSPVVVARWQSATLTWRDERPGVLDSATRFFSAQLALAQAQLRELQSLVQIYRSLGGRWLL